MSGRTGEPAGAAARPGGAAGPGPTRTLMWEAKAAPDRGPALLAWALAHADPAAEVYRGADGRVVVIDGTGRGLPDPPAELIGRPPHVWPFERVGR